MNNCVIYARFSSYGQNEQSIEAQVRICKEFAESKGLKVVNMYNDKARTGTNDSRPAFQQMIADAKSGAFQYIIVYIWSIIFFINIFIINIFIIYIISFISYINIYIIINNYS